MSFFFALKVTIYGQNLSGTVLRNFSIREIVDLPHGVCASAADQELFITDNFEHNIRVFSYQGDLVRTLGGMGLTDRLIRIFFNCCGDIVFVNTRLTMTVLTRLGRFLYAVDVEDGDTLDTTLRVAVNSAGYLAVLGKISDNYVIRLLRCRRGCRCVCVTPN